MSQASEDLIGGLRQAESIQIAAIDVLRDLTSLAVSASTIIPGGDLWMPTLDRAITGGFGTVATVVHWQFSVGVRAVEAVAPIVPLG